MYVDAARERRLRSAAAGDGGDCSVGEDMFVVVFVDEVSVNVDE